MKNINSRFHVKFKPYQIHGSREREFWILMDSWDVYTFYHIFCRRPSQSPCRAGIVQSVEYWRDRSPIRAPPMPGYGCVEQMWIRLPNLVLKPRNVTRSPKQRHQWPTKRTYVLQNLKKVRVYAKSINITSIQEKLECTSIPLTAGNNCTKLFIMLDHKVNTSYFQKLKKAKQYFLTCSKWTFRRVILHRTCPSYWKDLTWRSILPFLAVCVPLNWLKWYQDVWQICNLNLMDAVTNV